MFAATFSKVALSFLANKKSDLTCTNVCDYKKYKKLLIEGEIMEGKATNRRKPTFSGKPNESLLGVDPWHSRSWEFLNGTVLQCSL